MMSNAYEQGKQAFGKAVPLSENPHPAASQEKAEWETGWEDAKIEADLKRRAVCSEGSPAE
jgi:hypothetical protein